MKHCKVCFNLIKKEGVYPIINRVSICQKCYNQFDVIYKKEKLGSVDTLFLYTYNDFMKKLIYQFKGCYDIELKDIFLERFLFVLKLKYLGYYIVPVPSSIGDDQVREFNHVEKIFESLGLPLIRCLEKKDNIKQSNRKKKDREMIYNSLTINENGKRIKGKKILIVDDIYTTGNTLNSSIELVKKYSPNVIKALIICKNCRNSVNFLDRKDF